ncbi:MAG: hypothetical protein ACXWQQ_03470 [Pseudobdellovibrio sp.]
MSYNTPQMNELLLTYSFNYDLAAGVTYIREKNSEYYIPRINVLVNRWNNDDSQANIYLSAGSGVEKYNSENSNVRLAELVTDWESRKYYAYFEHLYMLRDNKNNPLWPQQNDNHDKVRLGFAPFLAGYNDLNVWLVAQFTKHNDESIDTTPLLRFYIKNVLWEVGSDFKGEFAFNFMVHI